MAAASLLEIYLLVLSLLTDYAWPKLSARLPCSARLEWRDVSTGPSPQGSAHKWLRAMCTS